MGFNDKPTKYANRKKANPMDGHFKVISISLSPATYEILALKSKELGAPITTLVSIALDNELDVAIPFTYECKMPENEFVEDDRAVAFGRRVMDLLRKFKSGADLTTLMFCRRDAKIFDKNDFMEGLRALFENGLVEEGVPKSTKFFYHQGYTRIKIKEDLIK